MKIKLTIVLIALIAPSICVGGQIASHDFDDGSLSPFIGFEPGQTSVSTDVSRSGNYSVKMEEGGVDGSLNLTTLNLSEGSVLFIRYYQYFPTGWNWSGISETGLKQMKVNVYEGCDGWPLFMFKPDSVRTHTYFSEGQGQPSGLPTTIILGNTDLGGWPSLNTWHKVEIRIQYSNTNGGYSWKMDDILIAGDENFNYDTWPPACDTAIKSVRFSGGNGFPSGGYYYVDDVEIWDSLPTAGSSNGGAHGGKSFGVKGFY